MTDSDTSIQQTDHPSPRRHREEPDPSKQFIRDLVHGTAVNSFFEVISRQWRDKTNGEHFLKLRLGDATGTADAVAWEDLDAIHASAVPGTVVHVSGKFSDNSKFAGSITLRNKDSIRPADPEEYFPGDIQIRPAIPYEQMVHDLEELIGTVSHPYLQALLRQLLCRGDVAERWRTAPAAMMYHQPYKHGLLEHSLLVAQGVSAAAATFPGLDRDVAVAGALLHDIGKIDAYDMLGGAIDFSQAGRLQGEIPLGYYRVRSAIEGMEGFPRPTGEVLLHILLSHHGKLEHGSPVVPCTREATLVHLIDDLGGTLGSFDRIENTLAKGEIWSDPDRALAGLPAYFPPTA